MRDDKELIIASSAPRGNESPFITQRALTMGFDGNLLVTDVSDRAVSGDDRIVVTDLAKAEIVSIDLRKGERKML